MLGDCGKYSTWSSPPRLAQTCHATWFFLIVSAVGASHVNPARKGWEASNAKPEHLRCGTNLPSAEHL
jgi:hypothetical protein